MHCGAQRAKFRLVSDLEAQVPSSERRNCDLFRELSLKLHDGAPKGS